MARPPANKPQSNSNGYQLPAPIKDPFSELMFLIGRLNGANIPTADRIMQLVMLLDEQYKETI